MGEATLTEFGRSLPKAAQEQAVALADVANRLKKAGRELYPGVAWHKWTPEMWDKVYARAEKQWAEDQRKMVGG